MSNLRNIGARFCWVVLALTASTTIASLAFAADAQETTIRPKIKLVGAFKNGIGVVAEDYEVSSLGRFVAAQPPSPLHGSFFVESDAVVETSANYGDVEIPIEEVADFNWTTDLKDRWLRVTLPNADEPIIAKVAYTPKATVNAIPESVSRFSSVYVPQSNAGVFLETKEGKKIWIANPSAITQVQIEEGDLPDSAIRQRDRLVFTVKKLPESGSATIRLFYMTQGLCWSPQYRVDLVDSAKLNIEQNAVLVNEWRDFENAPISLYSGFPQIAFQNVVSLMAPGATLQAFLSSLSRPADSLPRSSVLTQQAIALNNAAMPGSMGGGMDANVSISSDTETVKDGIDVYSQNVGEKTLAKNDRTMFLVDKKAADYKRVVYWRIGSSRADEYNNLVRTAVDGVAGARGAYGKTTSGTNATRMATFTEPWDVLEFKNPFSFPITTGAASVTSGTQFLGQNTLYWTNPGETTILPITKALSVRVMSTELERDLETSKDASAPVNAAIPTDAVAIVIERNSFVPDFEKIIFVEKNWGRVVRIFGTFYRLAVMDVEIEINNQRDEETEMKISQPIVGKLLESSVEGFEPEVLRLSDRILRPYGNFFNPVYELNSSITLKPRETRVLKFSYQTLLPQ